MTYEEGILVGCDMHQEWLLPWWWEHYSRHNTHIVAFADFGMSPSAIEWCQKRGLYCPPSPGASFNGEVSPENKILFEKLYGEQVWDFRAAWFKKPLACIHTPFERTLWLDLDCRVEKDLSPLFNLLMFGVEIVLLKEHELSQNLAQESGILSQGEISYNSGVIGFIKDAPVLHRWNALSFEHPELFPGDQQALSRAIYLESTPHQELPPIYNWSWAYPTHPNVVITHFHGQGKIAILKQLSK